MTVAAVRHVGIVVPDMDEALVELLHFVRDESPAPAADDLTRLGPTHAALTVEGIDALHTRLTDAGVAFLSEPQTSVDGRARVAFCRAPGGAVLELVEPVTV